MYYFYVFTHRKCNKIRKIQAIYVLKKVDTKICTFKAQYSAKKRGISIRLLGPNGLSIQLMDFSMLMCLRSTNGKFGTIDAAKLKILCITSYGKMGVYL